MTENAPPTGILETVIYAVDLDAAETFYADILDMVPFSKLAGRQLFYRCGDQVLLVFNPQATVVPPPADAKLPVPPHGATGEGHVCFRANADEIEDWKSRLEATGVVIEAEFVWPSGGRSIYFRDPAGNCLEFAEPKIWGLS
jgi:catechol 2,3-dioxygenase-like lactoylglutathione lyase family enzyme